MRAHLHCVKLRKNRTMKFESLSKLFLILCSLLLVCSCSKDDDTQPHIEEEENLNIIEIGEYKLLEESILSIPYLNKTSVTFVDSLNNNVEFIIDELDLFQTDSSYLYGYNVFEEGDTVRYLYFAEYKFFRIYNDSLNISFSHRLKAHPYHGEPQNRYIADVLSIWWRNPDNQYQSHSVFNHVINQRTWPLIYEPEFYPSIDFFDEEFKDVYYSDYQDPKSEVYYNYEYGIVSFSDIEGKVWRFENFE